MQTFQPKTTIGGCFLNATTGRLEIFMKRHTGSDKHLKQGYSIISSKGPVTKVKNC